MKQPLSFSTLAGVFNKIALYVVLIIVFLCIPFKTCFAQFEGEYLSADLRIIFTPKGDTIYSLHYYGKRPTDYNNIRNAIAQSLSTKTPRTTYDFPGYLTFHDRITTGMKGPVYRHVLSDSIRIDPVPLCNALKQQHIDYFSISIVYLAPTPVVETTGLIKIPNSNRYYIANYNLNSPVKNDILSLTVGYTRKSYWIIGTLLLILFVPILTMFVLRTKAIKSLQKSDIDPAVAWFGFNRTLMNIANISWIAWWFIVIATHAVSIFFFLMRGFNGYPRLILTFFMMYLPAITILLCNVMVFDVYAKVKELARSRREMMLQAIWGQSKILPLICISIAVAFWTADRHTAYLWLIGALAAFIFTTIGANQASGQTYILIKSGELHDKVSELAQRMGIQLQAISYIRTGKMPMANAAAAIGRQIILTDILISRLTKREVHAVVGHELAHLKHGHPFALFSSIITLIVIINAILIYTAHMGMAALDRGLIYVILLPIGLLIHYFRSRRFEFVADSGSASITGDPVAMITGLVKISNLNMTPLEWGRGSIAWDTHPETKKRIESLAQQAGLSLEQLQEIIRNPSAYDESGYYETKVFDKAPASKVNPLIKLLINGVALVLFPAIAAAIVQRYQLSGIWMIFAYIAGIAGTRISRWLIADRKTLRILQSSYEAIRQKLQNDGWPMNQPGWFECGYAMSNNPRVYNGLLVCDRGCLGVSSNLLVFIGDKTQFALRPEQIVSIELRPDWPTIPAEKFLYIHWRSSEESQIQCLYIAAKGFPKVANHSITKMDSAIKNWLSGSPTITVTLPEDKLPLETPSPMDIKVKHPKETITTKRIFDIVITASVFAIVFSIIGNVPFTNLDNFGAWYIIVTGILFNLAPCLPALRYKDH